MKAGLGGRNRKRAVQQEGPGRLRSAVTGSNGREREVLG